MRKAFVNEFVNYKYVKWKCVHTFFSQILKEALSLLLESLFICKLLRYFQCWRQSHKTFWIVFIILLWNGELWLVETSQMICNVQSECLNFRVEKFTLLWSLFTTFSHGISLAIGSWAQSNRVNSHCKIRRHIKCCYCYYVCNRRFLLLLNIRLCKTYLSLPSKCKWALVQWTCVTYYNDYPLPHRNIWFLIQVRCNHVTYTNCYEAYKTVYKPQNVSNA